MLLDNMLAVTQVLPQALTDGTVEGTAIDRSINGGMQDGVVVVLAGTVTDGEHEVALEESDNGSTGWTAVPAAHIEGTLPTVTSANDESVTEIGFRASKRYIRATVATTDSETGGVLAVLVALGSPRFAPVARS